jgi:hypothetical protein
MREFGLVILATLSATTLGAQSRPAFEFGAQATYWRLDHGSIYGNTTRWGPTVAATFRPSSSGLIGVRVSASYAAESDAAPGLAGFDGDLLVTPWRARSGALAPSISMGLGAIHFDAGRMEQQVAACLADPRCFFEGVSYGSGWRGSLHGGVGVQLGLGDHLFAAPELQLVKRLGDDQVGPIGEHTLLRFGLGLGWR